MSTELLAVVGYLAGAVALLIASGAFGGDPDDAWIVWVWPVALPIALVMWSGVFLSRSLIEFGAYLRRAAGR